jgi:hypothetical protein
MRVSFGFVGFHHDGVGSQRGVSPVQPFHTLLMQHITVQRFVNKAQGKLFHSKPVLSSCLAEISQPPKPPIIFYLYLKIYFFQNGYANVQALFTEAKAVPV